MDFCVNPDGIKSFLLEKSGKDFLLKKINIPTVLIAVSAILNIY